MDSPPSSRASSDPASPSRAQSTRAWVPHFVLWLSLAATAWAAFYVHRTAVQRDRLRFTRAAERTRLALAVQVDDYGSAVRNMAALFQTGGIPSRKQVHDYLEKLNLRERYPGVQGVGFALRIPETDRDKMEKVARENDVDPSFRIRPATPARAEYFAVFYLEPNADERNHKTVGLDMRSEPILASAMDAARDTASLTASGKTKLLDADADPSAPEGLFLFSALYSAKSAPVELAERRQKIFGYIFAPLDTERLFERFFNNDPHANVNFKLYDGTSEDPARLLHDSTGGHDADAPAPRFSSLEHVDIAGRTWTLRLTSGPEFNEPTELWFTALILVGGVAGSLTFFVLTRGQVRALASARDAMREVERSREELRDAKNAAEAANAAKDRFLAMVSHELRTPLAPVLLAVSIWEKDESLPELLRSDFAVIRRNIELEARLIEDLLDLARAGGGKLHLEKRPLDVHEPLRRALDVGPRHEAAEKNVALETSFDAADAIVTGDAGRLQQAFWNLAHNAVKFTPPGGRVAVRTSNPSPGRVRVEIADTGVGIDPAVLPKIFDAFEQGGPARGRSSGGLGLGLTIARDLVHAHGGKIHVTSGGKAKGATFTVELDTAAAPSSARGTAREDLSDSSFSPSKSPPAGSTNARPDR